MPHGAPKEANIKTFFLNAANVSEEELEKIVEEKFPIFKQDRSAWADRPGTNPALRQIGLRESKFYSSISEEDPRNFVHLLANDEMREAATQGLFDKINEQTFESSLKDMANLVNTISFLGADGALKIDQQQELKSIIGRIRTNFEDGVSNVELIEEFKKNFTGKFSDELQHNIDALIKVMESIDLTDVQKAAIYDEIKAKSKAATGGALKNLGGSLNSAITSAGSIKLSSGKYGDVSSLIQMMASSANTTSADLMQGYFEAWKGRNPEKAKLPHLEARKAFLDEFLGESFQETVEKFFKALDENNGTNLSPVVKRLLEQMDAGQAHVLKEVAQNINDQIEAINREIELSKKKRAGRYPAQDIKDTLKELGISEKDYAANPELRSEVGKYRYAKERRREEEMKSSFRDRYTDLRDQWVRQSYGDKIADKIAARREAADIKGDGLTLNEVEISDAIVELQHALRNMEALKAMRPQNDIIYTNELARKRRMAVKRGSPQRRLMERRHQANKQDTDDD